MFRYMPISKRHCFCEKQRFFSLRIALFPILASAKLLLVRSAVLKAYGHEMRKPLRISREIQIAYDRFEAARPPVLGGIRMLGGSLYFAIARATEHVLLRFVK